MASFSYKLDKTPYCPSCNAPLDLGVWAIDFVICDRNGFPRGDATEDICGRCWEPYSAVPTSDKTEIVFSSI
jgi:hypothetical protein